MTGVDDPESESPHACSWPLRVQRILHYPRRGRVQDLPGWHQVAAGYLDRVNDSRHESSTTVDIGRVARLTFAAVIVAAVVLVAVDNRRDVRVGYVVGDTEGPIWIVLLAAGLAGVIVGWLIQHRPRRSRG
jgi:uncharacterized integral membrane protein